MKRKVFSAPLPTALDELEAKISQVIEDLNADPELLRRCHLSVRNRAQLCMEEIGGHFEFLK